MSNNLEQALAMLSEKSKRDLNTLRKMYPDSFFKNEDAFKKESDIFFEEDLRELDSNELLDKGVGLLNANKVNLLSVHLALLGCYVSINPSFHQSFREGA